MSSKNKVLFLLDTVTMKEEVDFNIFKAQILDDIKAGKKLFGKDGAHLTQESRESGNRRNGSWLPSPDPQGYKEQGIISQQLAIKFEDRYHLL